MKYSLVQLNLNEIYFERSKIYSKLTLKYLLCMIFIACVIIFANENVCKVNLVFAGRNLLVHLKALSIQRTSVTIVSFILFTKSSYIFPKPRPTSLYAHQNSVSRCPCHECKLPLLARPVLDYCYRIHFLHVEQGTSIQGCIFFFDLVLSPLFPLNGQENAFSHSVRRTCMRETSL